jgi:UDP-N-acetylglucosamine 3-dehydrogenase
MSGALRAAVIGVGAMGRNHCRVYHDLPDVELVAVADADLATAERVGRSFGVAHFTDPGALLDAARPALVSIATPTMEHLPVALVTIAHGVHLLIEKPLAFTVAEGRQIIAAAHAAGVTLAVGHVERYNPALTELKTRLAAGALGRVFQMHAQRLGPFPARVRDVGVVVDLATHDVDIMRYLSGAEVTRVYAETARRIHTEHEDLLSGLLRFSDGTIGVLDINWLTPTKIRQLTVTGEQGMFQVNYLTQDLYFYENADARDGWDSISRLTGVSEGAMTRPRLDRAEPLRRELESFVAAVRGEGGAIVSGEDGLKAVEITQQIVAAGLAGRVVRSGEAVDEPLI